MCKLDIVNIILYQLKLQLKLFQLIIAVVDNND